MSLYALAFFTGLFGSLHCIGMCGPLALAIPSFKKGFWLIWDKLLYNGGRIAGYSVLGLLVGLAGSRLWLLGMQSGLSIASGVLIVAAALSQLFSFSWIKASFSLKLLRPFNRLLSYAVKHRAGHFFIGLLNGFLPCGFVYIALAGALSAATISQSVGYMAWFGVGTLPLMFIAMISAGFVTPAIRVRLNKSVPYLLLLMGSWFILRGMELNIPYISPVISTAAAECR
ncbi:sulfite exporter TauE/SafE family protein (plasmid) [Pedobacter sp. BS3]|uniref:sulfite exporter TauE/SafE family protein n=1 Tax=Pedobacter sp. BS3 TaxID=2567937 RepID=UPI0011EDB6EE|nr:sulfite exporter TauE/SafE family protein [Pedobacter sp. BS3]TZF85639.1 sulfite exporter TauE/SafE family protein [Pedobacter sp. BS3]